MENLTFSKVLSIINTPEIINKIAAMRSNGKSEADIERWLSFVVAKKLQEA